MRPESGHSRSRRWNKWLLYALAALCTAAGAAPAGAPQDARAAATYAVIQISPHAYGGSVNDKGQAAFTDEVDGVLRARFFDGSTVRDIGSLGGPAALAAAINDAGQVTGTAILNADGTRFHAYRWSRATGMVDLNDRFKGNSRGNDINDKGQVTGSAEFLGPGQSRAFFWSPHTGMLDIGGLGSYASGDFINNAGTVAGDTESAQGGRFSIMAFRWTRRTGFSTIGTQPDEYTTPFDMNALDHIVGETPFPPGFLPHAFLWTPRDGLIDLGTDGLDRSAATAINDADVVVGDADSRFTVPASAFVWTRQTGLQTITPADGSAAFDVNNRGQVVGGLGNGHAFLWTRARGIVDLNTRIPGAPAGLTVMTATQISETGIILAFANTGTVLLVPRCGCTGRAPMVGPIRPTGSARAGALLSFSGAFAGTGGAHEAAWSWGDGDVGPGTVGEKDGAGTASGQHTYRAPGIYTARLTVTDRGGRRTAVERRVVVADAGRHLAGAGTIASPPGASRLAPKQAGVAHVAFLSGATVAPRVEFDAPGIRLRGAAVDMGAGPNGQTRFAGTASVNGAAGYRFALGVAAAGMGAERIRMRVWHDGAAAGTQVVDYDNLRRGAGADEPGTRLLDGAISAGDD
jgi:probable HAF family extracellular repeat protein